MKSSMAAAAAETTAAKGADVSARHLPSFVGVLLAVHYALAYAFNRALTTPYMDEHFHAPQAAAFCAGRFDVWHPKITTFPGFYLVAAALANVASAGASAVGLARPSAESLCSPANLRLLNAGCGAAIPLVLHAYLRRRHPGAPPRIVALNALAIALFPPSFFFHFMAYTDTLSTLLVLATIVCVQRRAPTLAALPAAAAIVARQTNAVWAAFALGVAVLNETNDVTTKSVGLFAEALARLRGLAARPADVARLLPLAALPCAFLGFVARNGGVVVGDRAHHVPGLHLAQLLYACAVGAAFADPAAYTLRARSTANELLARALRRPLGAAAAVGAALLGVRYGTMCHPFLLADNRHFTFYLWKDALRRPSLRYAAVCGYVPCAVALWSGLERGGVGRLWLLGFGASVALVLVPSPLIEPRYLAVPYILLRAHSPLLRAGRLELALAVSGCVNAATMWLFLARPWEWPDGSIARFMW
jgi:alpha-1,2-glucosyltransferase